MDFQAVYQRYAVQLDEVEDILHARAQSNQQSLTASSQQLLDAGGKRLRPLFALICGSVGPSADRIGDVAKVAAALELTHMATLVHDDVIDHADVRRGYPTVRSAYGNLAAMYTGDFLFARAIQLFAEVNHIEAHREMSRGLVQLCQGEIEQIRDFYNWSQSLKTYLRRIERKTALLISLSCFLGAMVAGGTERDVRTLRLYGHYTGMAFQIIDDILDFTGSVQSVGKPVGGDLRQGNITLPALLAARRPGAFETLQQLVNIGMSEADAAQAIEMIVQSGALDEAKEIAERYLQKALSLLQRVSLPSVREDLTVLTRFVADRSF